MIFKLDNITGEITEISSEDARRALGAFGWTTWSIDDFFRSAKVLCTSFSTFCRFRDRLVEFHRQEARS